jgi:hypothetical protein
MTYDSIHRYRNWYSRLLRFHSPQHYARYGEGMEQTFADLLRERARGDRSLFGFALWMFVETSVGIIRENLNVFPMTIHRTLKFIIGALCLLFIPFFAMLFQVQGWDWDMSDFIIMAVLLTGMGYGAAFATNPAGNRRNRIIGIAIVAFLLVLYVHLAVGIVDTWPLAGS